MTKARVLRQRNWTEDELKAARFQYYQPRKRLIMAQVIVEPKQIELTIEVLTASAGDVICYIPGDVVHDDVDAYEHWPVRTDLFRKNYKPWDDRSWRPSPPEAHLMRHGCRPYYKSMGIHAQRLKRGIYVQSLESPKPVLVPAGRWLCIGAKGEPYHMNDENFRSRYVVSSD